LLVWCNAPEEKIADLITPVWGFSREEAVVISDCKSIGELRNEALAFKTGYGHDKTDIIIHFDDDDWSHPNRIAEQVALLQSSGADVVGYREMLFWRERSFNGVTMPEGYTKPISENPGEAWLYRSTNRSYALGTSLAYWRKTWERKPFPATSYGEDLQFCTGLKVVGVTSVYDPSDIHTKAHGVMLQPRMIARIHAGNTSTAYRPENMAKASEWRRAESWDGYCRSIMEAK